MRIKESKLKAAIQIALSEFGAYSEKLENSLIHHIKELSLQDMPSWKDVRVMLGREEIDFIPFYYTETKNDGPVLEEIIELKDKKHLIQVLKNIGIELQYGTDLRKPISYTESENKFLIDKEELIRFISTISFIEWNNNSWNNQK